MEFKRKSLEFSFDGEKYKVKFPSVKQLSDFQKDMEAKGGSGDLSDTVKFLEGLGLPQNVSYDLELEHLTVVMETISGSKKK